MSTGPILLGGRPLVTGAGPFVFGILNCTPDSFSDGGRYGGPAEAIEAGLRMAGDGADAIDVGGESTRPGSEPVSPEEQIRRTREVIAGLSREFGDGGPKISIDTRSAEVASAALEAGAVIVNDVSALRDDPRMAEVIAGRGAGVILMHMKGAPATMQDDPRYDDVAREVREFLGERIEFACRSGIARNRIVVDPGIGFGKTTSHNLEILRRIGEMGTLGAPVMVGTSRKKFTAAIAGDSPDGRRWGTLATVAACVLAGVECVRVHDVAACRAVADMCAAIRSGCAEPG